jgi:ABC-type glycerol-3-phosphate transport system substrate-binding protein
MSGSHSQFRRRLLPRGRASSRQGPGGIVTSRGHLFWFHVLLALCCGVWLSACSGSCIGNSRLTVLGEKLSTTDAISELLPEFTRQTGIEVNFVTDEYVAMDRKASDDLANRTAVYDVILQYNTALASYVQNRYVWSLDELAGPSMTATVGADAL